MSGGGLVDVLEPWGKVVDTLVMGDSHTGGHLPLQAPDPTAYEVFAPFLNPQIERYHRYKIREKLVL
jgi:hypothetical protein